jgi:hypothetical protein
MHKEQLGKNIFAIIKKETNTTKYFQIKHKTKIKISIIVENNTVLYTKLRFKKYLKFYIAWIMFHKELNIKHIGHIRLNNEQLNLIKDQLDPNIILYQAIKNKNQNLIKFAIGKGADDFDQIILDCCDSNYTLLYNIIKNKKYLYERMLIRAVFNKNINLIQNIVKKTENISSALEVASHLEYSEIFNIILKELVRRTSLNKN